MTMQLVGPYMTTTNCKKRKAKKKTQKLLQAEAEHEKFMRKMGVSQEQLEGKLYDKYGKRKSVNERPDYDTGPRMTSDKIAGQREELQEVQFGMKSFKIEDEKIEK